MLKKVDLSRRRLPRSRLFEPLGGGLTTGEGTRLDSRR